jgi:hypothetical protein
MFLGSGPLGGGFRRGWLRWLTIAGRPSPAVPPIPASFMPEFAGRRQGWRRSLDLIAREQFSSCPGFQDAREFSW